MRTFPTLALLTLAVASSCVYGQPATPVGPDGPDVPAGRHALIARAEQHPQFGGAWTDPEGLLHLAFVGNAQEIGRGLGHLIPTGLMVRFDAVDYTHRQLEGTRRRMLTEWPAGVTFVGIDPPSNRVIVGIDPFDQARAAELEARYGPLIEVVQRPPQRQNP